MKKKIFGKIVSKNPPPQNKRPPIRNRISKTNKRKNTEKPQKNQSVSKKIYKFYKFYTKLWTKNLL